MLKNKLFDALDYLRSFDAEMPIQTIMTLLLIYKHQDDERGISIKDIADQLNISGAAASRNVSKLTKAGVKSMGGLNLVTTKEDPMYRVRKTIRLTQKGESVMRKIQEML